MRELGETVG
jgi:hypothetical protein